jgi:hypothetical protein
MAHTQMPKQEFKECKPNQEAMTRVREDMYKLWQFKICGRTQCNNAI